MKKETIIKLYKRVNNILSNLSYKDFWNVNKNSTRAKLGQFTPKGKERKWIPYSLSQDTQEALDTLKLINNNMDFEAEWSVKKFIMKWRALKPEYLEDKNYYSNFEKI